MSFTKEEVAKKLSKEYHYKDIRTGDDHPYKGKLDRNKVNKHEKYEVAYFIAQYLNHYKDIFGYDLTLADVPQIEDTLHQDDLSDVVYRDDLAEKIAEILFHSLKG